MAILDPDVRAASVSLVAAHKRVVKEKNQQINALQAEKGELQRALQERPRHLTPDAITDEMVQRLRDEERALGLASVSSEETARLLLTAALTEPPARPEGAEDIEAVLYDALPSARLDEDEISNLANALANHRSGESA